MRHPKATCPRCGIARVVKPERAVANPHGICRDCTVADPGWPAVATPPAESTTLELARLLRARDQLDRRITALQRRLAYQPGHSEAILEAAADAYDVTVAEVLAPGRSFTPDVTAARNVASWAMRQSGHTLTAIGQAMSRDHTTSLHAIRRCEANPQQLAVARYLLTQVEAA